MQASHRGSVAGASSIESHRVVAAGGRIGGYGGGRNAVALKRKLLEREGVTNLC